MKQYFELNNNGIVWNVTSDDYGHTDDLEFSGKGIDCIIYYGCDSEGKLLLKRYNAFPTLRIANNTHGTLAIDYDNEKLPALTINGEKCTEYLKSVSINGILSLSSHTECGVETERIFIPASSKLMMCEILNITNNSDAFVTTSLTDCGVYSYIRGLNAVYIHEVLHDAKETSLAPGEQVTFCIYYHARRNELKYQADGNTVIRLNVNELSWRDELKARVERVNELFDEAKLETGNELLDTMYRFCKVRAGESIFTTKGGSFHSPGGRSYYAATWCNDQVEYAGPWFAFTGDTFATHASINAYKHYMPFMSDAYLPIPSSVISEGSDHWAGAGDRGDAAMYLYGGSLFALTNGTKYVLRELWPGIKWCAEYCKRKTLEDGVVSSDSDELEGRFGTDRIANLSTSSLAYGGYRLAAIIAESLGETELAKEYNDQAERIEAGIETHFGAELYGYKTYRYSNGFNSLRAWICLPMCMGITKRLEGTLDAMFSDRLWTSDGMLTCEKGEENPSDTVWDRATLYGFKGAFMNGKFGDVWTEFMKYCRNRLLCDRVPYAVEAWPEGDMRHLSGESALFCRIISEGLLAIRPESMTSFSFIPRIPEGLEYVKLRNFRMNGDNIDIIITSEGYQVQGGKNSICGKTLGERIVFDVEKK